MYTVPALTTDKSYVARMTIDVLPDDVLLDAFGFYVDGYERPRWQTLVHVCRRWRNLVFASPRRLGLQLLCTHKTPVREMLDVWPAFPMQIQCSGSWPGFPGVDDIVAALEHPDRVLRINLRNVTDSAMERFSAVMQVPFPELTYLEMSSTIISLPILPDAFLGGSILRLRYLSLERISLPSVRGLLLSAGHLIFLSLWELPHSEYLSLDVMVACLPSFASLETLRLGFRLPESRPYRPSLPPPTRVIVPALTSLSFCGCRGYLEGLVAQIDTPSLHHFDMTFFMDFNFDVPHFSHFLGRASGLNALNFDAARVVLGHSSIKLKFHSPHGSKLQIHCRRVDWQVSSMALICSQLLPFLSHTEQLHLLSDYGGSTPQGEDNMEFTQFLELFRPFSALRSLYITKSLLPFVVPALQELAGERATDILPNLRDLFLERSETLGYRREARPTAFATQQLSGHPIAIHSWARAREDGW